MACTAGSTFFGVQKARNLPRNSRPPVSTQVHWRTFDCPNQTVGLSASSQTPQQVPSQTPQQVPCAHGSLSRGLCMRVMLPICKFLC